MKGLVAVGLAVGLAVAVIGTAILASAASLLGVGGGAPAASSAATAQIPTAMLTLYQQAAATCPGLPWTILAAIGTIESDNGQSTLPGRPQRRQCSGGRRTDAVRAGDLCRVRRTGAARRSGSAEPLRPDRRRLRGGPPALRRRRRRWGRPVGRRVRLQPLGRPTWRRCSRWRSPTRRGVDRRPRPPGRPVADDNAGAVAVSWALSQIGTPYVWGGETPGVGFDCSGLVQAAYAVAGVALPRVAQDQYDATPKLAPGARTRAGRSRLLRGRAGLHRPRRAVRRRGRRPGRHGRRAAHGRRRAGRGLSRHTGRVVREPALRGGDAAGLMGLASRLPPPNRYASCSTARAGNALPCRRSQQKCSPPSCATFL